MCVCVCVCNDQITVQFGEFFFAKKVSTCKHMMVAQQIANLKFAKAIKIIGDTSPNKSVINFVAYLCLGYSFQASAIPLVILLRHELGRTCKINIYVTFVCT